jgi:hypothetical protein
MRFRYEQEAAIHSQIFLTVSFVRCSVDASSVIGNVRPRRYGSLAYELE